jgi:regulator of protease activity HflC (stomatin/prohibitin superfamily)
MDIVSPIIDLFKEFWEQIMPCYIVKEYEHGVMLRFGKFHSKLNAGLIWKIPFVDEVLTTHNTITTMVIQEQSLVTKDDKNIVIAGIVKYKITNPKTFLLEVEDVVDAINDITKGKIKDIVIHKTWEEVRSIDDNEIKDKVEEEVKNWGIKIYYITITDLAQIRTIRLINSTYDKDK